LGYTGYREDDAGRRKTGAEECGGIVLASDFDKTATIFTFLKTNRSTVSNSEQTHASNLRMK
jgi:hypothetical protein